MMTETEAERAPHPVGPPILAPGEQLSPTLMVLRHIHRGEELDVYEAADTARFCRVLVKTARPDFADNRGTVSFLQSEVSLLSRMTHPHIVRMYEVLHPEARPPMVLLEVLTGLTLRGVLRQVGRLSLPDLATVGEQLSSALRYVHSFGFMHLDVKPANVICDGGITKLLDFSLARVPGVYKAGIGTPNYASPEQLTGDALSEAADVWGLGLLLYESATGSNPFDRPEDGDQLQVTLRAPAVRSSRRLPASVGTMIDSCLEPKPQDRPVMAEISAALVPQLRP